MAGMSYDEYNHSVDDYGSYPAASFEEDPSVLLADNARGGPSNITRPRILLMGTKRSGKSSIQKVVFHKMSPHESLFLEPTMEIRIRDISTSSLIQFHLLDFPGNFDFTDHRLHYITPMKIFHHPGTLVFVIDAQDDENQFSESIDYFLSLARQAYTINPLLHYDILIHKVDGDAYLSDEHKNDCYTEIKKTILEELQEAGLSNIKPSFHLTSIYDHTIFEAFSKIIQSLIPSLPLLENLLDALIQSCDMDKAFLFDIVSKIYIATDSNPVDMQTYELCSDMIDVVIDISCIYGMNMNQPQQQQQQQQQQNPNRLKSPSYMNTPSITNADHSDAGNTTATNATNTNAMTASTGGSSSVGVTSINTNDGISIINLGNNYILYLREINKFLVLVCLMRSESFAQVGLIEYNFLCLKKALDQVLEVRNNTTSSEVGGKLSHIAEQGTTSGNPAEPHMMRTRSEGDRY